jgi:plastocyanin
VKVIAIVVLGSFAFSVTSYSFVAGQNVTGTAPTGNVTAPDNATSLGNVTGANQTGGETTTANATGEIDTFNARGHIASIVSDALTGKTATTGTNTSALEILGGYWKIDVIDDEVRRVEVNMSMAKPDGSDFHMHPIDNFTAGGEANETTTPNATSTTGGDVTTGNMTIGNTTSNETTMAFPQIITEGNETGAGTAGDVTAPAGNETTFAQAAFLQDGTFEISGTANIYTDDNPAWQNVPVTIESMGRVLITNVDHEMTENHFKDLPIYGFVTALIGEVDGGRESLLPSIAPEVPPAPAGPTPSNAKEPTDNETAPTTNQTGGASGEGGTTEVSITPGSASKTTDAFDPNPVEVSVGDTVTWTNDDSQPHTVTSGSKGQPDGKFDSSPNFNPLVAPQQSFNHTFEEAGEYPYYCALHPNAVGTVNVSCQLTFLFIFR